MSKTHRYNFLLSFVDMLFAMLLAFALLFYLAFLLINTKKHTGKVDTDAQDQIVMTWTPDLVANDIDLWVKPPSGPPIGYSHLQNTYMYLARDDLGNANDLAIINGKSVPIPGHREVTSIRKLVDGHYVVNAEFFAIHVPYDPSGPNLDVATPIKIQLIQVNPYAVLATSSFVLKHQGDQHTAFSFDVVKGVITNINTINQDPFVFGNLQDGNGGNSPGNIGQ